MAVKTLQVKLEGKAELHEPRVRLEDMFINLFTVDGGTTWENKGVQVNINDKLDYLMSCKAISGTDWTFSIKDKDTKKKLLEEEGTTGEKMPNFSRIEGSVEVNPKLDVNPKIHA